MDQIVGDLEGLPFVALKALLLYVTAVLVLRVTVRRTLAQMSPIDFVAAVAVGAIVGRVPNADMTTYLAGAATLVTILVANAVLARLRHFRPVTRITDHPPQLLVSHGVVLDKELKSAGLIRDDLYASLRHAGVRSLDEVRYVIFEQRGALSVVRENGQEDEPLVEHALPGDR